MNKAISRVGQSSEGIVSGLRDALPIMLGYGPLAFAYGVLAVQTGLSVGAAVAMSVFVYAGASQFMALALIATGAPLGSIVLATLVVNLRHVLMSAAISPYLGSVSRICLAALAYELTDESFAVISERASRVGLQAPWMTGLQLGSHMAWICGSALGAWVGSGITDPSRWGFDFALTALFIALLLAQIKDKITVVVAVIAVSVHRIMQLSIPGPWGLVLSAMIAAWVGSILAERQPEVSDVGGNKDEGASAQP
ncbi:MAG: AzlC family ABC transporter permease [Limnochordia bacterium]|jgi:4-azaleucine resistance transporter AzlC